MSTFCDMNLLSVLKTFCFKKVTQVTAQGACRGNSDCPSWAPYCSKWGSCRPEPEYNHNGPSGSASQGQDQRGACSSNSNCPSWAPYCSRFGFCRPEREYNDNGKNTSETPPKKSVTLETNALALLSSKTSLK